MSGKKTSTLQKKSDVVRLKLLADCTNLGIIRKFITGIATMMGFSKDEIYQIELAVDEACTNVINHAYMDKGSKEKNINVTVKKKPDQIEITIADRGVGFDPDALKTPNMDEYLKGRKPGGLGVHLIKTLMDEVNFRIKPGVRNEVEIVKYFKPDSETDLYNPLSSNCNVAVISTPIKSGEKSENA